MLMKKIFNFFTNKESLFLFGALAIAGIFHAYNMFHYPFFENDEGTYLAQAWSFLTHGKLAPYTYWYDHAPLGWLFTSVWLFLTGGLFTFGFSLYSARIFMLLIHLASTFFLYKITKKITKADLAAFLTTLFFSISPLAIYFQRRLLLDNLMVFWILLSFFLILFARQRLWIFLLSAVTFGIAVLTKENAIFWLPLFTWLVYRESHKHNKLFATIKWVVIGGMIISLYPLYAILKGELFPVGSMFSSSEPHVSLLGTLQQQASRGSGLPFWDSQSDFMLNLRYWYGKDPLLIIAGFSALFIQGIQSFFNKTSRLITLLTLSILAFLMSGKLVINFYIIPLIPFLAMCIGYTIAQPLKLIKKYVKFAYIPLCLMVLSFIGYYYYNHTQEPLLRDETSRQVEAINWIKKNVAADSCIAIDFYGYEDLVESRFAGDPKFSCADWFWKVELDPDIREKKLHDNPKSLDYVMVTAEIQRQLKGFPENDSMLRQALRNSSELVEFSPDPQFDFTLDLFKQRYPNGDWVVLYKQNSNKEVLASSWDTYKKTFMDEQGRVTDPYAGRTTSEGQSYALLRAVWLNDKETFDKTLNWSIEHILLEDKNLFAWWYGKNDKGKIGIVDKGTATDADQDIAVALLFASKQWNEPEYKALAQKIIADIWAHETAVVAGKRYIVAGNWSSQPNKEVYTVNPSYLSPYAYRMFAEVDKKHNWMSLVDSSYEILDKCSASSLEVKDAIYLAPDWCNIKRNGEIVPATNMNENSTNYSFDAIRVPWRIALDYQWYKEQRALNYLKKTKLFTDEWNKNNKINTAYTHDGKSTDGGESLAQYSTQLAYFTLVDKKIADAIYDSKILSDYRHDKNGFYWGDKNNYYNQNWVWFGTAFYTNNLPNIWGSDK